jgi:hypothetical protein
MSLKSGSSGQLKTSGWAFLIEEVERYELNNVKRIHSYRVDRCGITTIDS